MYHQGQGHLGVVDHAEVLVFGFAVVKGQGQVEIDVFGDGEGEVGGLLGAEGLDQ
jgi:hypothetical protein